MRNKLAAKFVTAACAGLVVLPGCHPSAPPAPPPESPRIAPLTRETPTTQYVPSTQSSAGDGDIVASANGATVTRRQLVQPLIEAYGLGILLNLVQLELAKQQTARLGTHVSPEDVRAERDRTLSKMFTEAQKSDYEQLLDQFVRQQHLSRTEFELVIETNTYLRKLSETQLPGKIDDEKLHMAFNQLYGENRQIRDIQLANMREVGEAKQRIGQGEAFEKVAREMSHDTRSASLGGELPPFSSQSPNVSEPIKQATFVLKVDEVSDPVLDGSVYHLIKLIHIIPPKIVKFEDVKESVRRTLEEQWIEFAMKEYRNQLAQLALQTMQINEPVLREQWKQKLDQQHASIRDRDSALQRMNQQRENAGAAAATAPTTVPTEPTTPAPAPAASGQSPAVERPPATTPGAAAPTPAPGTPPVPAPATQP